MSPQIATNTEVDLAGLLEFVRPRHRMVLTTHRRDGAPQLSPVSAGVDPAGRIVIATYPRRAKAANLRRSPAASLLVLSDEWNGPWVQVDGTAEVLDLPDALEPRVEYFRTSEGEQSDGDEYREAMGRQGKCRIRVAHAGGGRGEAGGYQPEKAPTWGGM